MPLDVLIPRARGLPRPRLLRAPDPYVEIHYFAGTAPIATSSPARKRTEPEWPGFRARIAVGADDPPPRTVGIVVRDDASRGAVLGRCFVRVAACVTEGWFPLDIDLPSDDAHLQKQASRLSVVSYSLPKDPTAFSHPAAEIYVRIDWPEYCKFAPLGAPAHVSYVFPSNDDVDAECRAVADEPGRLFRCGEMVVSAFVLGVPSSAREPQLTVELEDQRLRGYEVVENAESPRSGHQKAHDELFQSDGRLFRSVPSRTEYNQQRQQNNRRNVNFGSFAFALFQGTCPTFLKLMLRDRSGGLAKNVFGIAEQTVDLPANIDATGFEYRDSEPTCDSGQMNVDRRVRPLHAISKSGSTCHVLHFRAAGPGEQTTKVIFDVRVSYYMWKPAAVCNIVTPRFRQLLAEIDNIAPNFKAQYPVSSRLKFLFVGGLFTRHYPKYFDDNISYLRDELKLTSVDTVPIHTERSVARNAETIRNSVMEAAKGSRCVVLIGHSKGATDITSALARYPELTHLLYGIVSFQSPFGGTFLVDFVSRKEVAVKTILGIIENLWGGDRDSFLDMGYSSRMQDILYGLSRANKDWDNKAEVQKHGPQMSISCHRDMAAERVRIYGSVPTIAFASCASFSVQKVRSLANAAGFATMAPAAQKILHHTGFFNDGLVIPCDARVPHAELVFLTNMMHTEPALYFPGTPYPPGKLTACAIALLCEKWRRSSE